MANAAMALSLTGMGALPVITGGSLSAALGLLAVDEQFQLHERFKAVVTPGWLKDSPTILVGVGGIVLLVLVWQRLATPTTRALFTLAVSVGVFALWVDLGSPPIVVGRLEEGFEVIAESLFLCGLLEHARLHVQSGAER